MDGLTSQNVMPVDGDVRDYRERHSKRWRLSLPEKREEWKWMKDDLGVYSKHSRQQMKMIWTLPFRFSIRNT